MRPNCFCLIVCFAALVFLGGLASADDGTYYGQVRHGNGWYDVATTFDADTGHYRIADGTSGTLRRLGVYPQGIVAGQRLTQHLYEWTDSTGKGLLKVVFKDDRFEGYWHKPGNNRPSARWNGHKPTPPPALPIN
jgi:hypothetical protein